MRPRPLHHLTFVAMLCASIIDARLVAVLAALTLCLWIMSRRESVWLKAAAGGPRDNEGENEETAPSSQAEIWTWALAAIATTLACFALIEIRDPLFFTHDDNYVQSGAAFVACRSAFEGVFPTWNPYQGGGEPLAECQWPTTYPPLYLAYAVSRYLLHNEFLLIEVFTLFHLVLAVGGGFWAGRKWGLSPALAAAASLAFAFSGFLILTARCWFVFTATASWLPLILGFCAPALVRRASWKWALGLGLVIGCSFHASFSQIWVYAVLLECVLLLALLLCRVISFRNALWNVPVLLIGAAVALPLAYVQMDFGKDVARQFSDADSTVGIPQTALWAMLVPPPFAEAPHPRGRTGFGAFYYTGGLFTWACVLLCASLIAFRWQPRAYGQNVLLLLALLMLFICLGPGSPVPVSRVFAVLPWFKKFRQPWRYLILFNLFGVFAGALFCERCTRQLKRKRIAQWGIAIVAIGLVCQSMAIPITVYWRRPAMPYPNLPLDLASLVDSTIPPPERSAAPLPQGEYTNWFGAPDFTAGLQGNCASIYQALSFNRYNTLTWYHSFSRPFFNRFNDEPAAAYRAYGIRWVLLHPKLRLDKRFVDGLIPLEPLGNMMAWEVPEPSPLAFAEANPTVGLPIVFSAKGATVELASDAISSPAKVVVNVLGWPRFRVYADHQAISWAPDEWGRIVASTPANTRRLEVVYCPPWRRGLQFGAVALALAVATSYLLTRTRPGAVFST